MKLAYFFGGGGIIFSEAEAHVEIVCIDQSMLEYIPPVHFIYTTSTSTFFFNLSKPEVYLEIVYIDALNKTYSFPQSLANGHITLNTPVLVRSLKLSSVEPSQYLDG